MPVAPLQCEHGWKNQSLRPCTGNGRCKMDHAAKRCKITCQISYDFRNKNEETIHTIYIEREREFHI